MSTSNDNVVLSLNIDESGKPSPYINSEDDLFYVLTGVLADGLADSIVGFTIHRTFKMFGMRFEELHAKDLFRGIGGWRRYNINERVKFLEELFSRLKSMLDSENGFLTVISVVGIKKNEKWGKPQILESTNIRMVFENLLERSILTASRQRTSVVIKLYADISELNQRVRNALENTLYFGKYVPSYSVVRSGRIRVEENLNFVNSKIRYSIQLADLIGYIVYKWYKSKYGKPDKHYDFDYIFELVKTFLDKSKRDKIEGYGLKQLSIYYKADKIASRGTVR